MRKIFLISVMLLLMVSIMTSGCAQSPPAPNALSPSLTSSQTTSVAKPSQPITLRVLTFARLDQPAHWLMRNLITRVNERSKGELTLKYLGGPEMIASTDQAEAIKTGVADVWGGAGTYYNAQLPECEILMSSTLTYEQERKSGFMEYFRQLHVEKMNSYFLGGASKGQVQCMLLRNPVKTVKDLDGLRIRGMSTVYNTFMQRMGIKPVSIPGADTYTALQQGLIDGGITTTAAHVNQRNYEVTKYLIDHYLWNGGVCTLINLSKWNALPKSMQDLLNQVQIELEPECFTQMVKDNDEARQALITAGIKPITFSADDAKSYIDLSNVVVWDTIKPKISAESYTKLSNFLKP